LLADVSNVHLGQSSSLFLEYQVIKLYSIAPFKKCPLFFHRCLLKEDKATIKCLAVKLTQHLVDHIKVSY